MSAESGQELHIVLCASYPSRLHGVICLEIQGTMRRRGKLRGEGVIVVCLGTLSLAYLGKHSRRDVASGCHCKALFCVKQ